MTDSTANGKRNFFAALLKSAAWLLLAAVCVYFGYTRFELWQARINPNAPDILAKSVFPADAEQFETSSIINQRKQNYDAALADANAALRAKPQDYALWLRRGQLEELLEDRENARASFEKAVELAPDFASPRLVLGNFLVADGKQKSGFGELRRAYKLDPQYFGEVAEFAWLQSNRNVPLIIEWLSPLNAADKFGLADFLLEHDAGDQILPLVCRAEDLDATSRATLTARLIKQEKYRVAALVEQQKCDGEPQTEFKNADFESAELSSEYGFDWFVPNLPDTISVFFTETDFYRGARSLNFSFNGDSNPNAAILSQIVAVEKKQKYQLRFAWQAVDLKTGGVPVLQISKLGADYAETILSRQLVTPNEKWQSQTFDFAVDDRTEAIEIKVARACAQTPCPIFGQLRLDDFALEIKR